MEAEYKQSTASSANESNPSCTHNLLNNSYRYGRIGGFLILLAIKLVLSPLAILYGLLEYLQMIYGWKWDIVKVIVRPDDITKFKVLLYSEFVFNIFWLGGVCVLIGLFFSRKKLFPRLFLLMCLIDIGFVLLDSSILAIIFPYLDYNYGTEIASVLIPNLLWMLYICLSKRVKLTFVR